MVTIVRLIHVVKTEVWFVIHKYSVLYAVLKRNGPHEHVTYHIMLNFPNNVPSNNRFT
jgi:hypothetical protein